jgi:GT2 family glycosyltransferase
MSSRGGVADVEVSIVSLRGGSQLESCLAALSLACAGLAWRLTLVDNSPSGLDPTQCLHGVNGTVIRSEGRRGFGANQNLVLAGVVREQRARYALVLNDDTEPGPRSITTLVQYADERPHIGAVAPDIADSRGNMELSMVAWPTLADQALNAMFPRRELRTTAEDGWLNGACMLVRTAALADVGLFDPQYFLFFEETDLCRRLTDAGWHTEHCSRARVVHHKSQTTMRTGARLDIEQQILRSQYVYFRKHHGKLTARVLNTLTRSGFMVRAVKAALEATGGREPRGSSTAGVLWALAVFRPDLPTRFEIEARPRSSEPHAPRDPGTMARRKPA